MENIESRSFIQGAEPPRPGTSSSLGASFLEAARRHPKRPAVVIEDEVISYEELALRAGRIAACLRGAERSAPALGAVFGSRTATAYEGIVGTLLSGAGYVPLNPKFPDARNAYMIASSGASTLVLDVEGVPRLGGLLADVEKALLVVVPYVDDVGELAKAFPRHRFVGRRELAELAPVTEPPAVDPSDIAYLIFTSGTTGTPKGVVVEHRHILYHLDVTCEHYRIDENDRLSQTFDLTFDASVWDVFAALTRGASVHVVPEKSLLTPDKFIRTHELTVWFSVPSIPMMMRSFKRLGPGTLPSLRLSMLGGERLPPAIAKAWKEAAENSRVDNLYGPTEVTISCTGYALSGDSAADESPEGGVPIGVPHAGLSAAVVDDDLKLLARGERGELCFRGPQVVRGYWLDEKKTADRFVAMPWWSGPDNRWYRTGDVAYIREDGQIVHCGRNDDQIKLHGLRIELGEIEQVISAIAQTDFVAVVPYPRDESGPRGLVAAVARTSVEVDEILRRAPERLAPYMVPQQVVVLEEMPLNANGKIDKRRVFEILQERDAAAR